MSTPSPWSAAGTDRGALRQLTKQKEPCPFCHKRISRASLPKHAPKCKRNPANCVTAREPDRCRVCHELIPYGTIHCYKHEHKDARMLELDRLITLAKGEAAA